MDFSALETAWRKQIVPSNDELIELVAARLKHEVASAQRRIRGGVVLAAFVLFSGWTVTIVAHLTSIKRLTPVALIAEVVYSILVVAFFVRAFESARTVQREMEMMGGTLRESTAAALRTVELQIQNARIAVCAIPVVVAISVWLSVAKYIAGDLPGFGTVAASAFTIAFGAMIGAAVWHRYRTHLVPRRKELREMLRTLGSDS